MIERFKQLYKANVIKTYDYILLTFKRPLGRLRLSRSDLYGYKQKRIYEGMV
jgi:hypothetical protein